MSVKRFVAADMRRALELVREEMGPDAIILSNRRVKGGVEIFCTLEMAPSIPASKRALATDDEVISSPLNSDSAWGDQIAVDQAVAENNQRFKPASNYNKPAIPNNSSHKTSMQLADEIEQAREKMLSVRRHEKNSESSNRFQLNNNKGLGHNSDADEYNIASEEVTSNSFTSAKQVRSFEVRAQEKVKQDQNSQLNTLQTELADMRNLLEQQLGRMAWGQVAAQTPLQANLYRRFNRLGLSTSASESLIKSISIKSLGKSNVKKPTLSTAWPEVLATLSHQLPVVKSDPVDGGGIFAFIGPTGVGKTTTIGKLAARYVLKHGAENVTLVTTDTYRIAACDQLRSLGRILNVPVRVVDDSHSLPTVLAGLHKNNLVLIDTAGFRCGDKLLDEQLLILSQQKSVKKLLVLSANSQVQSLQDCAKTYSKAGLSGCILTKLDECSSLGGVLGMVLENDLPVIYTTDGQEIPQDIDCARGHQLVAKAVSLMKDNAVDEMALADDFSNIGNGHEETVRMQH